MTASLDTTIQPAESTANAAVFSMRHRIPAQSVLEELVQHQANTPPRSFWARIFGRSPLNTDSTAWYQGARGEIAVGGILARLPESWTVFHALPVGTKGSDIDHLVVGPGGVFTINTKHHGGKSIWVAPRTFMVNGQKRPYLRNSEHEAARVTKMLKVRMPQLAPAQSVIALVDPKKLTIKQTPHEVQVLDARHLRRWLTKRPIALTATELEQLVEIIDDPATWSPALAADSSALMAQFDLLHSEVKTARLRHNVWVLLLTAAFIGAGIAAFLFSSTFR